MPHPKNRLKLTGDTRLPDVMDFMNDDEEDLADAATDRRKVYADGYVPPAMTDAMPPPEESRSKPAGPLAAMEHAVAVLPARSPWLAVGAGILSGWLVARMLRR